MNNDMDAQFLCKDCARFNMCQYYDRRKENSYICKYFHLQTNKSHWNTYRDSDRCECAKCGHQMHGEYPYCPNCGADMRESIREKIRCNTCKNNDDELSGECYECVKGIFDHYEKENKTEVENGRTND